MNTTDRPGPPHPSDVRGTDVPTGDSGRPPLVRDPTLTARFTRSASRPGRRFAGKYPGAVVAAVCLAGLGVVVGARSLAAGGSPAAASTGPAPAPAPAPAIAPARAPARATSSATARATSGAATARTPSTASVMSAASTSPPTPSRRASATAAAGPPSPGPLTSPIRPGAPAPTALQASAGAALLRNPAIRVDTQARRQLRAGRVDVRLSTVLAAVAAQAALTIHSFPATGGDPPGSPVRQAVISATDPLAGATVTRALSAQAGDYAVQTTPAARRGQQLVRLRTAGRR